MMLALQAAIDVSTQDSLIPPSVRVLVRKARGKLLRPFAFSKLNNSTFKWFLIQDVEFDFAIIEPTAPRRLDES